jgi:A/G-specific adenine glycosylase
VLVSEVMLQQTQTSRVVETWARFLEHFPTPLACADAPLASTLKLWKGLGYHRRAKALHEAARVIRDEFGGEVPNDVTSLRRLPGVGDYTANAVASFAFNQRVAVLDTNVGRVLARAVTNRELRAKEARLIAHALLPRNEVAAFNQAMLDLGAQFCKATPLCSTCPVAKICRWHTEGGEDPAPKSAGVSRPQSVFEGSDRQVRGRILAVLREGHSSKGALAKTLGDIETDRFESILGGLVLDGLIEQKGYIVQLAGT